MARCMFVYLLVFFRARVVIAQSPEGVCYAKGSICDIFGDTINQCNKEQEAHGYDGWIKCICESGFVGISKA
jgi:hypothetical protein